MPTPNAIEVSADPKFGGSEAVGRCLISGIKKRPGNCLSLFLGEERGSNPRPSEPQSDALTN